MIQGLEFIESFESVCSFCFSFFEFVCVRVQDSPEGFRVFVFEGFIGGPRGSGFLEVSESFMGSRRRLRGEWQRRSGRCIRLVKDL